MRMSRVSISPSSPIGSGLGDVSRTQGQGAWVKGQGKNDHAHHNAFNGYPPSHLASFVYHKTPVEELLDSLCCREVDHDHTGKQQEEQGRGRHKTQVRA